MALFFKGQKLTKEDWEGETVNVTMQDGTIIEDFPLKFAKQGRDTLDLMNDIARKSGSTPDPIPERLLREGEVSMKGANPDTKLFGGSDNLREKLKQGVVGSSDEPLGFVSRVWRDLTEEDNIEKIKNATKHRGAFTLNVLESMVAPKEAMPVYSEDGLLIDVQMETEDQRIERLARSNNRDAFERRHGELPEKGSWQDIVGEIGADLMDPITTIWYPAKGAGAGAKGLGFLFGGLRPVESTFGKVLALGGMGGALEIAYETASQQAKFGNVVDPGEVAMRGTFGALVPGGIVALPALAKLPAEVGMTLYRGAEFIGDHTKTGARHRLRKLERKIAQLKKDGFKLSEPELVARAIRELGYADPNAGLSLNGFIERTLSPLEARAGRRIGTDITSPDKVIKHVRKGPVIMEKSMPADTIFKRQGSTAAERTIDDKIGDAFHRQVRKAMESDGVQAVIEKTGKYATPLSTRVKAISPEVFRALRKFEFNTAIGLSRYNARLKDWKKAIKDLNRRDPEAAANYHKWMVNSKNPKNKQAIIDLLRANPELGRGHAEMRKILDELYEGLSSTSKGLGWKIPEKLEEYFPRIVKAGEQKGYERAMGVRNHTELKKKILEAINKKGAYLDSEEYALIVNKHLRSESKFRTSVPRTGREYERTVDELSDDVLKYMETPAAAIERYIHEVSTQIEIRKFLGAGTPDSYAKELIPGSTYKHKDVAAKALKKLEDGKELTPYERLHLGEFRSLNQSIGTLLARLANQGKINGTKDIAELDRIIRARFQGGESHMNSVLTGTKNLFYTGTLNDPMNALVQFGDLPAAAVINGIGDAFHGVRRTLGIGERYLDREKLGLKFAGKEFASTGKTAKLFDYTLRAIGFDKIDALGKGAIINGAAHKMVRLASQEDGMIKLMKEYGRDALPINDWIKMTKSLKEGKMDDNAMYLAYSKLSDAQPISYFELPQKYNEWANGRIFYMLKTFALKQIDLMRTQSFQKMKNAKSAEEFGQGFDNMVKYGMLVMAANTAVGNTKDWMLGRDPKHEDPLVYNLVKNFAISKYIVDNIAEGNLVEAGFQVFLPPISTIDKAASIAYDPGDLEWLRVTPYGDYMYNWFGPGYDEFKQRDYRNYMDAKREEAEKRDPSLKEKRERKEKRAAEKLSRRYDRL